MERTRDKIVDEIIVVLYKMHDETVYFTYSINEGKARDTVNYCLDSGFVYFDGKCVMLGHCVSPWFSDDTTASDILLYTLKEYRGNGLAKGAVRTFIDWAKKKGANNIKIGQSTGVNEKEFNKMADSLGLNKIGAVYNV